MAYPLQPHGSNDIQAVWTADNTLVHQPSAPLLYHENFDHGGAAVGPALAPDSRQWAGPAPAGLDPWRKWSIDPAALVDSWVDIERRQGIVQIQAPFALNAISWAGMIVPFPTPPSFPFRCIIYGRIAMGRSVQELPAIVDNIGGIFVSFNADAVSDGEVIAVGTGQGGGLTEGMIVTADYIRAYDGTALPSGSLSTNGATVLV